MGLVTDTVRNLLRWLDAPEREKRGARDAEFRNLPVQSRRGILHLSHHHGPVEYLFDNRTEGDALSADLATRSWADDNTIRMSLGRILTSADDDNWLVGEFTYTAKRAGKVFYFSVPASLFRGLSNKQNVATEIGLENTIPLYTPRNNQENLNGSAEMIVALARHRLDGADELRLGFGTSESEDVTAWRGRVCLVPWAAS